MSRKILGIMVMGLLVSFASKAHALEVISPYVVKGEAELEQQGALSHDLNPDASNEQSYVGAFGYSPTDWWRSELELEFGRNAGTDHKTRYAALNTENTFQLAEPGKYWIDPGAFVEFDFGRNHEANTAIFGLLGEKSIGRFEETANLLLHKDFGGRDSVTPIGLIYSNQLKYRLYPWMEPGFEFYGDTNGKEKFADQQFSTGPGLFGKIHTFDAQAFKYQVAYLRGATPATPDSTVRWKLEYEFYF